jgi:hypothetical protein
MENPVMKMLVNIYANYRQRGKTITEVELQNDLYEKIETIVIRNKGALIHTIADCSFSIKCVLKKESTIRYKLDSGGDGEQTVNLTNLL